MNKCKLCHKDGLIRKSHIVPKFVSRYLKETSPTGYLRESTNINKRVQDGRKISLLCDKCELRLSQWESDFASQIFYPHNNLVGTGEGLIKLEYDSNLIRFVISLFWRIEITYKLLSNIKLIPDLQQIWTDFLNMRRNDWGNCEFHLIFLDAVSDLEKNNLPKYLNTYIFRLYEWDRYDFDSQQGLYIKLPGMLLFCSINPTEITGFSETRLYFLGTMYCYKQHVTNKIVGKLLISRSVEVEKLLSKISQKEYSRIEQGVIKKMK